MPIKRDRILRAAERLLAMYGVDGIRLRDIAAEAGVSIGLIQHHFGSRDDVVREMLLAANAERVDQWTKQLDGVDDNRERLRLLLSGALSSRERCIVWTESCAAASRHDFLQPLVSDTNNAWRSWVVETIERGVADGTFQTCVPPRLSRPRCSWPWLTDSCSRSPQTTTASHLSRRRPYCYTPPLRTLASTTNPPKCQRPSVLPAAELRAGS